MSVQKIQYYPSIKDITQFLFSSSNPIKTLFATNGKSVFSRKQKALSTAKTKSTLGWNLSNKGMIAPDPFAAATSYAKKNGLGFVVIDHDMIVRHINANAEQFLSLPKKESVGHVFDFFIMPNEKQVISIMQENGKPGVGRMSVRDNGNSDEPYYLILIEDLARKKPTNPPNRQLNE